MCFGYELYMKIAKKTSKLPITKYVFSCKSNKYIEAMLTIMIETAVQNDFNMLSAYFITNDTIIPPAL